MRKAKEPTRYKVEEYRKALQKYAPVHDGKLLSENCRGLYPEAQGLVSSLREVAFLSMVTAAIEASGPGTYGRMRAGVI